jgi:hypothetical protein
VKDWFEPIPPGVVDWDVSDHSARYWIISQAAAEAGWTVISVEFTGAEPYEMAPDRASMLHYLITATKNGDAQ